MSCQYPKSLKVINTKVKSLRKFVIYIYIIKSVALRQGTVRFQKLSENHFSRWIYFSIEFYWKLTSSSWLQQIRPLHLLTLNVILQNFSFIAFEQFFKIFLNFHLMSRRNPKILKVINKKVPSLRKFVMSISSNVLHFNEVFIRLQKLNENFFFQMIFPLSNFI